MAGRCPAGTGRLEERLLAEALAAARVAIGREIAAERYEAAMTAMARLRQPLDRFFDAVMVNADDPGLRVNRLRLLAGIRAVIGRVADFSLIES